jgi:hypothetical protein
MTMRILRTAIAVLATAAVLLTGAWAGGSCAPAPARAQAGRQQRIPIAPEYGESARIPVADALVVNGQPLQLSVFYTTDAPGQVIEFYSAAFRARGLLPVATAGGHPGHVSVFDPADGLQRGVTALPERSGHTLVLLAVSDPRRMPRLAGLASGAPYPVPEPHRGFLGYSSEDGSARAHSGQFVTSLATEEVAHYYREQLRAQGFEERGNRPGEGLLVFSRPGSTVSVALQALEAGGGSAVFVNHTEGSP